MLKDALERIARPVFLADHSRQPKKHTDALVVAACLDDLDSRQNAIAVAIDPRECTRNRCPTQSCLRSTAVRCGANSGPMG